MKRYQSYTFSEASTGIGQIIRFSCDPDNKVAVKTFIEENIRSLDPPSSAHRVNTSHGTYGRYSRYDMVQHKYAGGNNECGGGGYTEVLEIKNPPDERNHIVIYEYNTYGTSVFSEWNSLDEAIKAWENIWGVCHNWYENEDKPPGFKRLVKCGSLTPWFYAVGDESLHGDYAISAGLEDDPVFWLGRRFVVQKDGTGLSEVRTCMGCRFHEERRGQYPYTSVNWRIVYFDDGTTFRLRADDTIEEEGKIFSDPKTRKTARPFHEGEEWIEEAVNKFRLSLSGIKEGFQIKFADGSTFTGKLAKRGKKAPSVEGRYNLKVTYDGGKIREGWTEFVPTLKYPDIVCRVCESPDFPNVEKVEIVRVEPKPGGKKWSGVYFTPSERG